MIRNKTKISVSNSTIFKLKVLAKEKESVRQQLVVTAKKLATTAKEKEGVRRKLVITANKLSLKARQFAVTAKEKESVRQQLVVTAKKLATTAKEKEGVRRKLVITANKLSLKAQQLAVTAKEKESVRRLLAVTAEELKKSHKNLEKKVFERTKDLETVRVKEEAILLSIGDGLITTDEKGNITRVNKMAEKLLGLKSKDVMGKFFSEALLIEDEKGVSIAIEKHPVSMALKSGITTTTTTGPTYYNVRKDKTRFPVAITATPVTLDGNVIGTIKIFRDITSEREIDKAKTEFVSLASHQLRTPLSTVNWYAEMLLAGDVGELNDKQKKYLDEVYRSNQRMVELVNALLDVSRLELGTFAIEPITTDIIELAQNVIDEQTPQINDKKLIFSFKPEKKEHLMSADPKLLRMVVQNILSNSVKYTPEGGKIEVSFSFADKDNILLKISDTGYGIPKYQQDKIFSKLFRADNVRDKDTDGTGLGLYIIKSIVENSGGKIHFESPCSQLPRIANNVENPGTTFYVTLPRKGMKKIKG